MSSLKVADFSFCLPDHLIARYPASIRDGSRLMHIDRASGGLALHHFSDITGFLQAGDLLVLNDTKVVPARILAQKETGGRVELFMVRPATAQDDGTPQWYAMLRSSKACRAGTVIHVSGGVRVHVVERTAEQEWLLAFPGVTDVLAWLDQVGSMPIPPYLERPAEELDRERYQTVFARSPGAVAAPTAGLHFTERIFNQLREQGVQTTSITLHVGLGTFQPVRATYVSEHIIHRERFHVSQDCVAAIAATRQRGGRVVAVGTTSLRTLEYLASSDDGLRATSGEADIFIYPGYRFKAVDALITNFHLPESTLLMLVSAFAGTSLTLQAYNRAVEEQMRFYSYGDAMFIS